jgi:heptosyltransferase-2
MGVIKTIEVRGKQAVIKLVTSIVRTKPMTRDEILASPPKRILVIRQHHQMGDMLLATPAFRAIKETFPGVELGVLTSRINRDVLLNHPYVDNVHTYSNRNPLGLVALIGAMRRCRYDMVIVLHTVSFSFTSAWLALASGARLRVGSTSAPFGNSLSRSFYNLELPLPTEEELRGMNEAEHNLYPLRALGVDTDNLAPVITPSHSEATWAREFVERHRKPGTLAIIVHPGAGKAENIWPPAKFAEVANRLAHHTAITLFTVEGPRDAEPVAAFERLSETPPVHIRQRSIGEVAAALRSADLVVCNDTGVMHVASAAGATTLAVFGPTDPVRWAPRCPNLNIVRSRDGNLESVTPGEVYEKAVDVLALDETKKTHP